MAQTHTSSDDRGAGESTPGLWRRVRRIWEAFGNTPRAFRLVWECSRNATLSMAGLTLLTAALPAAQAWVGKLIVDGVVTAVGQGMPPARGLALIAPYLGLEFGLILIATTSEQLRSLAEHLLHSQLTNHVNTLIMQRALTLDLSFFEDARFYDKLQNARREADMRALRIVNDGFFLQKALGNWPGSHFAQEILLTFALHSGL